MVVVVAVVVLVMIEVVVVVELLLNSVGVAFFICGLDLVPALVRCIITARSGNSI